MAWIRWCYDAADLLELCVTEQGIEDTFREPGGDRQGQQGPVMPTEARLSTTAT
jgi:hypothetical protein